MILCVARGMLGAVAGNGGSGASGGIGKSSMGGEMTWENVAEK